MDKNQDNLESSVYPKFKDYFSDVLALTQACDQDNWEESTYKFIDIMMKTVSPDFQRYKKNDDYSKIMQHTIKVIKCIQEDTRYATLSETKQNVLLWVALFHDCAKLSSPDITTSDGRDPAHPFRSCQLTIKYLDILNILSISGENIQLWNSLFQNAYCTLTSQHKMEALPKITLFLEKLIEPFFRVVLKLICLHQCIPCTTYVPASPIDLHEISLYLNQEELELLEIFWYNDSYSYTLYIDKASFEFGKEISDCIKEASKHCRNHKPL